MIEVAAGILTDARGRVLLMQRLPGKHLAGLWEFPGGKLEQGETVEQALGRELGEELGIELRDCELLVSIPWCYPEKSVILHALRVTAWSGEPRAREGHPLRWMHVAEMEVATMPAADAPIVTALRLPAYYVITKKMEPGTFLRGREGQGRPGSKNVPGPFLVQLRVPDASREAIRQAAIQWLDCDPSLRERLLINHDIELARELGVGVHLKAAQLRELAERPLPAMSWIAASCHDREQLELAAELQLDFATLSPVRPTASHPNAEPLGWVRFAELVAGARLPVYALGGVGPADLQAARAAGAQGIAGIRAFVRGR